MEVAAETESRLGAISREMLRLFRGDNRRVMQQLPGGGYGVFHKGPLRAEDLRLHLEGRVSVACYLLDHDTQCATVCFDVDIPKVDIPEAASAREELKRSEFLPVVRRITRYLEEDYAVSSDAILLEDTGGRGYHVWLFFEQAQPAGAVVALAQDVKLHADADSVEVFPPSAKHGRTGYSKSLVRLPLGRHRGYLGARSTFLSSRTFDSLPAQDLASHLRQLRYTPSAVLEVAEQKRTAQMARRDASRGGKFAEAQGQTESASVPMVRSRLLTCSAISALITKAKQHGHLAHHERVVLALTLCHIEGGMDSLRDVLRCCSDFSAEETQRQVDSLAGYRPVSCARLQGPEYRVCAGWCSDLLRAAAAPGCSPTPLWLLTGQWQSATKEASVPDADPVLERVASVENLHLAWKQAILQAAERDVFEDVQAYDAFEDHLWANLRVLRADLLSGTWRHQPFRVLDAPKSSDDPTDTRPMCWATPWDAIVDLAVLNVIGPAIDSTFHANSLGNRLARGPRAEGQVFEDWRKQNRFRELRREGFSRYSEDHYYVLADIAKFYECVRHDNLMLLLRGRVPDQRVLDLLQQFLEAEWRGDGSSDQGRTRPAKEIGIPQGPALSALLANLYLDDLDSWLESTCVDFVRYVDDMALLLDGEQQAESALTDLGEVLQRKSRLLLSDDPTKTKGPFPATDAAQLADWLRDARYELAKCTSQSQTLTDAEKAEMIASLSVVSGAELQLPEERERLVRYLGFYVANTEKLDNAALQRGVYSIALHILDEERPRHNATCIAVRALTKACTDFGDQAWQAIEPLVKSRRDVYFRVVLAQEARRFLQRADEGTCLHSELQLVLEEEVASQSEIAAAAAIACLRVIGQTTSRGRDRLWQRFFGESGYLRARAGGILSSLDALTAASIARVLPSNGDELAAFLHGTSALHTHATVEHIAAEFLALPCRSRALAPLLEVSLATLSTEGLRVCAGVSWPEALEATPQIYYAVASRYIRTVIAGRRSGDDVQHAIRAALAAGHGDLAKTLYDLARFSLQMESIPDLDIQFFSLAGQPGDGAPVTDELPRAPGVRLTKLVASDEPGAWLHEGNDAEGNPVYHEALAANQLEALGHEAGVWVNALNALGQAGIVLLSEVFQHTSHKTEYVLVVRRRDDRWQSLWDRMNTGGETSPIECSRIVERVASLLTDARDVLERRGLPCEMLPVPSCHTLAVDEEGHVRFQDLGLAYAGGRRYVGLDRQAIALPHDHWEVFSLGLLLFELVTQVCAVRTTRYQRSRGERYGSELDAWGAFLKGIVGKATAAAPDRRYETAGFFAADVKEWSELETAISTAAVASPLANRVRHLWHIQLGVERRTHLASRERSTVLDAAASLATYVLKELERGGETLDEWVTRWVTEIRASEDGTGLHTGPYQVIKLAQALEEQWQDLMGIVALDRSFTVPAWLRGAAASSEIDAARRSLYVLSRSTLRPACGDFCINTGLLRSDSGKPMLAGPDSDMAEGATELPVTFVMSAAAASDRLLVWSSSRSEWAPEPQWPEDLDAMAVLLLIGGTGLTIQSGQGRTQLGPASQFDPDATSSAVAALLSLRSQSELPYAQRATAASVVEQVATSAVSCAHELRLLCLSERRFGLLPSSAFQGLCARELSQLNLKAALGIEGEAGIVSGSSLLSFPSVSPLHSEGCPFSADFTGTDDASARCVALSLPAIVSRAPDGRMLTHLRVQKATARMKATRRYIARCCIGVHTFFLAPAVALYFWQVHVRQTGTMSTSPFIGALETNIPDAIWFFLVTYGAICLARLRKVRHRPAKSGRNNAPEALGS